METYKYSIVLITKSAVTAQESYLLISELGFDESLAIC